MSTLQVQNRAHVIVLTVLLVAFIFRVLAQLVQFYSNVDWLPPFTAWAAGGLPYPLLVAVQIVILAVALDVIRKLARDGLAARRNWAVFLIGVGSLYSAAMAFRLAAGVTFLSDIPWFAASLPAIFHLVLASFVLTLGHYHWSRA